jgi:hypothetical protein
MNRGDNDHELFARVAGIDPALGVPTEPASGPRAAALLEHIMTTDIDPVTPHSTTAADTPTRRRRPLLLALGGVAIAALAVVGIVALRGSDTKAPTSMSLSLPPSKPIGAMCVRVDALQPAPGTVAFRGTVTSIDGNAVTLKVTKWYANGTADQVVVTTGTPGQAVDPELSATFEQGGDYLVAATDGQVMGCGMTAPYSADLDTLYQGWVPA